MPNPLNRGVLGGPLTPVYIAGAEAGSMAGEVVAVNATGQGDVPITLDGEAVVLGTGAAHVGQVGTPGDTIMVTPAVTAGAYAAGDVVGGRLTFANAARAAGLGGAILNVTIVDDAGQDSEMELWVFNSDPTAIADNAAFVPAEADLHTLAGIFSTTDSTWRAAGTPSACHIVQATRYDPSAGTSIFAYLVDRTGGTLVAVDDITVILHVLQD